MWPQISSRTIQQPIDAKTSLAPNSANAEKQDRYSELSRGPVEVRVNPLGGSRVVGQKGKRGAVAHIASLSNTDSLTHNTVAESS